MEGLLCLWENLLMDKKELEQLKIEFIDPLRNELKSDLLELFKSELTNIFDAKNTANMILEAKKLSIESCIKDAVKKSIKTEVNSKIDRLSVNINKYIEAHTQYHRENEPNWGIIGRMQRSFKKSPIKFMGYMILFLLSSPLIIKSLVLMSDIMINSGFKGILAILIKII